MVQPVGSTKDQPPGRVVAVLMVAAVGSAVSVTVMETAVALAGLTWAAALAGIGNRRPRLPRRSLVVLCGALAAWSLLSAVASAEPARSLGASTSVLLWVVVLLASTVLDDVQRRRVQALLLVQVGLLGLWAVADACFWWEFDYLARVRGPFSSHMTLAGFLLVGTLQAFPAPDLGALWPSRQGRRDGPPTAASAWLGRAAVTLGLAGLVATLVRSAVLAALAGCVVLLVTAPALQRRRRRVGVLMALAVLVAALGLSVALPRALAGRPGWGAAAAASIDDRLALWRAGLAMVAEEPLVGIGANRVRHEAARFVAPGHRRTGPPAHLHSAPLTLAAERGLPALGILGLLYGLTLWRCRSAVAMGADGLRRGALAAVVGFLVMGLFEDNLGDSEVLFVHLITLATIWSPRPTAAITAPGRVVS